MKKIITAAIGGVLLTGSLLGAGIASAAGPSASDLTLTPDEIAWASEHGRSEVCDACGANLTTDGFVETLTHVMNEGWETIPASRIMGYSIGTYCPEHLDDVVKVTQGLPG